MKRQIRVMIGCMEKSVIASKKAKIDNTKAIPKHKNLKNKLNIESKKNKISENQISTKSNHKKKYGNKLLDKPKQKGENIERKAKLNMTIVKQYHYGKDQRFSKSNYCSCYKPVNCWN